MSSFHSNCMMTFPSEDCRIYDIHYMWPILLIQFILCVAVVAIRVFMFIYTYRLYKLLNVCYSPLLFLDKSKEYKEISLS